jgi:nitrate/nitrite transport system ATP-binding protein
LNILSGLDQATLGTVLLDGKVVDSPGLDKAVVFQNHSLLPWLSALKNVEFGVAAKHRDWTKSEVHQHSVNFLKLCSLEETIDRKPSQLSGGMRQRVGLARAFALESELLLLDEPFGALDALTRGSIQDELVNICRQTEQTVFMITHDVDEAILLADRIFLMSNGPYATISEIIKVDIPKPRSRANLFKAENYYATRNHIIDFLVNRCNETREKPTTTGEKKISFPPEVSPQAEGSDIALTASSKKVAS